MASDELAGRGILITRPEAQAGELAAAVEAHGGRPILFPVMEIEPRHPEQVAADENRLESPDISIFVSANAVRYGLPYAADSVICAIGPATAAAITESGYPKVIRAASGFDSEHLLAELESRDVSGQTVRIIRGEGGREVLAETLRSRGARVDYLEVYARRQPDYSAARIEQLQDRLTDGDIHIVTAMSVESLCNLLELLNPAAINALGRVPLVTPSARVIKEAHNRLTDVQPVLAAGPQAGDMIRAMIACCKP